MRNNQTCRGPLRATLAAGVAAGALAAALAAPAMAQTASDDAASVEEVVVTGSSIRGVAPVGSPLIGVTRDTIQAVAPTNVKDLMQTVPQLGNFGANSEQSTPGRFRNAGFQPNIHNLGPYATLTLINGHRVAPMGDEATSPDPSTVPPIAIQRVELVADGASAIYGSDAVAGVVNFIFRKPFDGLEASSTYSFNDTRYRKRDVGLIGGKTWDGGGVMLAYEYSDNRAPLTTEVPTLALASNQTSRGGRDLRSTTCLSPIIRTATATGVASGATYVYPLFSTNLADRQCGILYPTPVIEEGRRHAVLLTAEQQINDTIKLWTEVNYGLYRTRSPRQAGAISVTIPNTNPFFVSAPAQAVNGVAPSYISVTRSGVGIIPNTENRMSSRFFSFTAGADVNLGGDWKATTMFHGSGARDTFKFPGIDTGNLLKAAAGTTRATALDLFTGQTSQAVIDSIVENNTFGQWNYGQEHLYELQIKADGPVFTLPGGEVRAAVGMDFRNEQLDQLQTGGSPVTGASFNGIVRDDQSTATSRPRSTSSTCRSWASRTRCR